MEELTLSTMFHFIIMIIAAFVIVSLITNSSFLLTGEAQKFASVWSRGILKITAPSGGAETSVECKDNYKITLKDLGFFYAKEGESVEFFALLEFGEKLYPGTDGEGNEVFKSGSRSDLIFEIEGNKKLSGTVLLHVTFWRYDNLIKQGILNEETLYDVLNSKNYYPYYLSSADIKVEIKCKTYSESEKNIENLPHLGNP